MPVKACCDVQCTLTGVIQSGFAHMYPPHITVCGEGIRVDGLANAKVLGLLVVYSGFMES
jgi:hypothetical protein